MTNAVNIVTKIKKSEREREEIQLQINQEIKKQTKDRRSETTIAYAQAIDELGLLLKSELNEITKYVEKRSTDKELLNNINKMLTTVYKRFIVETTKIIMD